MAVWFQSYSRFAVATLLFLTSCRQDPSVELFNAAGNGEIYKVKTLIANGTPLNAKSSRHWGWTSLMVAIFHNKTNVAYLLIEKGADVNVGDNNGVTPLMLAISQGDQNLSLTEYLLRHGADISAKDKGGATAFSYAKSLPAKPRTLTLLEATAAERRATKMKDESLKP